MKNQFELVLRSYEGAPDFYGLKIEDINSKSRYGDQVIHMACVSGNLQDLAIFLDNGADVNARGESGMTPLHYAVEQGHAELVKFLLAKGANKNLKDDNGDTPADTAKLINNEDIWVILNG